MFKNLWWLEWIFRREDDVDVENTTFVRRSSLLVGAKSEHIQRDNHVIITGPSNIASQ
jgi:hypothetical protein